MLKINRFQKAPIPAVRLEENAPIVIDFHWEGRDAPLYWRCGDFSKNLLEIGIDKNTNMIVSVVVVLVEKISIGEFSPVIKKDINGCPCIVLEGWPPSRYKDEFIDFKIGFDGSSIAISFVEDVFPVATCTSGCVSFGFNELDELVLIIIKNIPSDWGCKFNS